MPDNYHLIRGPLAAMNTLNPYAAPETPPAEPSEVRWHREFELTQRGIRCHSGLELPPACLVTGDRTDLAATTIAGRAVQPWLVYVIWWGIATMLVFAIFCLVLVFRMPGSITVNSPVMILLVTGFPFMAALLLVFGYSRLSAPIQLKVYHSRGLRKWRWMMNFLGFCPAVVIFLLRIVHLRVGIAMLAPLAGVFLILSVMAGKKLAGIRPVVRWVSDDLFEVSGFSKPFRNVLDQHVANAAGKITDSITADTASE
jgi:hypothetical protein